MERIIKSPLRNDETFENGIGRFNILVAHPAIKVQWFQDETEIDDSFPILKFEKVTNANQHSLIVKNCLKSDFTIYTARCTNAAGETEEYQASLSEVPRETFFENRDNFFFSSYLVNSKAEIGGTAYFSVLVSDSFTDVKWCKGGKELPHSYKYERLKNKNERSLSIYNVEESDLGMYTVKQDVKRKYNSMSAMLEQLVVEVKPEPVEKTTEEASEAKIEEVQEKLPEEKPEEIVKPLITKASESTIDFKYPPEVKLRNKKKTAEDLEARKKAEEAEEEKRAERRRQIEAEEAKRLQEERENEVLYKNLPESERSKGVKKGPFWDVIWFIQFILCQCLQIFKFFFTTSTTTTNQSNQSRSSQPKAKKN